MRTYGRSGWGVVRALTEYGDRAGVPKGGLNADLQSKADYLSGHTFMFLLDVLGLDFSDVRPHVSSGGKGMGKSYQLRHPKFPEAEEPRVLPARTFLSLLFPRDEPS